MRWKEEKEITYFITLIRRAELKLHNSSAGGMMHPFTLFSRAGCDERSAWKPSLEYLHVSVHYGSGIGASTYAIEIR